MDAAGHPVRVLITSGTAADCLQAHNLIVGLNTEHLLADRSYDSNDVVNQAESQGMKAVIPPKKDRKDQREYDKEIYKKRHFVENAFLHLKRHRGIAIRYAKKTTSFS